MVPPLRESVSGEEGFLLLEVVVALVLFGLLLGPLVEGVLSVTRRTGALVQSAASVDSVGTSDSIRSSWSWGSGLTRATWRPGPELVVQTGGSLEGAGRTVGLWTDGWFAQESVVDEAGRLRFSPDVWWGRTGQEVVLRSRLAGSAWGPPWRTIVPSSDGKIVVSATASSQDPSGSACWALHLPGAVSAVPDLSWTYVSTGPLDHSLPFVRSLPPVGTRQAGLDGTEQTWTQEEGRELDLYY